MVACLCKHSFKFPVVCQAAKFNNKVQKFKFANYNENNNWNRR